MSNFSKVSVGISSKKYTHDMSFDNNTSADFGSVQPLFSQLLNKDDKLSGNIRQLVRLAPMPVPSFGRMRLVNKLRFVPITDICPYYEAMLAQEYVNNGDSNYLPISVPTVSCAFLSAIILSRFATVSYYKGDSASNVTLQNLSQPTILSQAQAVFAQSLPQSISTADAKLDIHPYVGVDGISFDGADYIVANNVNEYLCFRLSDNGKRLRSILIGLGYVLDLTSSKKVSLLPLFAFYKAYFDVYAPKRTIQWMNTNCYTLIDYIFEKYVTDFYDLYVSAEGFATPKIVSAATSFFDDLANVWYTTLDDYVSAHRTSVNSVAGNTSLDISNGNLDNKGSHHSAVLYNNNDNEVRLYQDPSSTLTQLGLNLLSRFSRFINKDTVIGRRVSDWLKVHYGADVASSFFKDSVSLDDIIVNCNINDIFSTSDTAQGSGENATGDYLGSYAGKGLGFGDGSFSFTAPTFGYFIVLTTIVPDSGYFQGIDPTLFAIDRYTLPSADFDALGFEVTPKCFLTSGNDIAYTQAEDVSDIGFGFVPRFSAFKTRKNIVNGDMSRRGTISSYAPYYLDRILQQNSIRATKNSNGSYSVVPFTSKLPLASEVWRYPTRYPWLGDFDRIFYNSGNVTAFSSDYNDLAATPHDDNFLIQSVISLKLTNHLKPIAMSYDTFEEDTDNSSKTVTQQ